MFFLPKIILEKKLNKSGKPLRVTLLVGVTLALQAQLLKTS
jgi:hypothetical protein